jgi:hypothetical protein
VAICVPDICCIAKISGQARDQEEQTKGFKRLTHVDENPVRHIIGQAYNVVDHLLIMRFNFPFNISFM